MSVDYLEQISASWKQRKFLICTC